MNLFTLDFATDLSATLMLDVLSRPSFRRAPHPQLPAFENPVPEYLPSLDAHEEDPERWDGLS
jgi:hypothetical protein